MPVDPAQALYPEGPSKQLGNELAEAEDNTAGNNFNVAMKDLNMNEQEQFLYQMHLGNLHGRGGVDHPDGSRSSLYQAVHEHNGKFYNIPTVWDGKLEVKPFTRADGTKMDVPNDKALANVEKLGWDKFPSYATSDEADERYDKMHSYMEKDTQEYLKARGK